MSDDDYPRYGLFQFQPSTFTPPADPQPLKTAALKKAVAAFYAARPR